MYHIFETLINFYRYIHAALIKEANNELIIWPDIISGKACSFSNKDLLQTISNYRQQLINRNIKKGSTVLLALPVSIAAINAILAIQSLGAIPVLPPANPNFLVLLSVVRSQNIKFIIVEKDPGVLLAFLIKAAGLQWIRFNNLENETTLWEPALVAADQAALITHSSGSTGKPKAIYRSHQVLSAQHLVLKKIFPSFKQRDFPLFPNIILHNLSNDVTSVLPFIRGLKLKDLNAAVIVDQLQTQKIETLTGNVFYFKKILGYLNNHPHSFPLVKALGIGGSPVSEYLAHSLKQYFPYADCFIIYGSSEAEPISVRKISNAVEYPLNGYAVGKPCDDIILRINKSAEIHTTQGLFITGEIEVKGAHVATCEAAEWLQTGDIGYLTTGNNLYLTARKGNERPHKKIQHYQVEHLLQQLKGVINAGVISTSKGFNVFIEGQASKEDIWQIINNQLPQGIINDIYFTTQMPVDARHLSKILYSKLK